MEGDRAALRLSELERRKREYGVPDAICIRNDSFSEGPFIDMVELASTLWTGKLILESDSVETVSKALVGCMDRAPLLIGANRNNFEGFCTASKLFGCPLCIGCEDTEELLRMAKDAEEQGVTGIVLDPLIRNMKMCLETCTEMRRLGKILPEARWPVAVRVWSGEYAMSVGAVSLLISDNIVVTDDLDEDICETLGAFIRSVR